MSECRATMDDSNEPDSIYGTIVWKNEALVLVDKKPCVLTVPGRQGDEDPRPCLGRWLQEHLKNRLFPVHRLDYEVSGAVVFALNSQAHRTASLAFEGRAVRKRYQAITALPGAVPNEGDVFVWESRLVRGKRRSFEAPHGQLARTHARFVGRISNEKAGIFGTNAPLGLWELTPETGKPHQLRVHLTNAGFPIAGDLLYGGPRAAAEQQGIALRAVSLMFQDEATRTALGTPMTFDLPLLVART